MKSNKKKTYPTYADGGFFNKNKFGQIVGNYGKALADAGLSTFGASNVIKDSDYKGGSAKDFARGAKIVGGITSAAAPIAMNMIPPGSGQLISGVQKTVGGFNPQDQSQYNEDGSLKDPGMAQFQQGIASAGRLAGQAQGMGLFAMGGMQFANGGTGEINSEVEKQENAMTPNGQFTQFNGPSHSNGGIKTDMAPGTMIFSDKLKAPGTNKTFAKLNAGNNTNREDKLFAKGNLDPKSEASLKLTMMAKMKNSNMLFAMQEQLKKDKVAAYAKKIGVQMPSMDNEQMEPQGLPEQTEGEYSNGGMIKRADGSYSKRGLWDNIRANAGSGKEPTKEMLKQEAEINAKYKEGGIHINPANKGKFTASAQRAGMGTQEFANHVLANKEDYSSTQVKRANFAHNAAGWKHAIGGVQLPYYNTDSEGNPTYAMGGNLPMYPNGARVTLSKPEYEQAQRDSMTLYKSGKNFPTIGQQGTDLKTFEAHNRLSAMGAARPISGEFNQSYAGYDPSHPSVKWTKPTMVPYNEANFTVNEEPQQVRKPATFNTVATPRTFQYINDPSQGTYKEQWNRQFPEYPKLSYGGYIPKFAPGGLKPNLGLDQDIKNAYREPLDDTLPAQQEPYGYTGTSYADEQAKLVNAGTTEDSTTPLPSPQGFDWKNAAEQVGMGLLQNAGNIYNLSRYNKPEVEKYERMQSNLLSDKAAMRDAEMQARRTASDLRNTGLGLGALTSNQLALNAQSVINKDRVRQQYGNINAEIQNRANQYNTGLAMQEVIANAQNRARNRSGKGEAVAGIGQNVSQQMLDAKKGKMDEKTLAMYQSYFNNPQFKAAMKKAGYDVG